MYRPGCQSKAIDALSRRPNGNKELHAISIQILVSVEDVKNKVAKDDKLWCILQDLLVGSNTNGGYELRNWSLMYKNRIMVPRHSRLIPIFLAKYHSFPNGKNFGFFRTHKQFSSVLYWEEIQE